MFARSSIFLVLLVLALHIGFAYSSLFENPFVIRQDLKISEDGNCGGTTGQTCQGSEFGDCCSEKGYCGGNGTYCGTGCQSDFGTCATSKTSSDGSCGGPDGTTCLGSDWGNCCSARGYCGGNSSYCGTGCQSEFGTCPQGSLAVSSDGSCGGPDKISCQGSDWGNCCSARGYCGANSSYCGNGCQGDFGTCFPVASGAADLSSAFSSATPSPSSNGNTGSDESQGPPGNAASPRPNRSDDGMTGGIIAGIVIGAVGGIAMVALAVFFIWRRRQRANPEAERDAPFDNDSTRGPSPQPGQTGQPYEYAKELPSPTEHELAADHPPYHELSDSKTAQSMANMAPVEADSNTPAELSATKDDYKRLMDRGQT